MNEKPTIEVGKVPIITKFIYTLGVLPTSYLMSMTYQEQVTWLCNYIQTTLIPQINEDVEAIQELQTLYELLRTYVNNSIEEFETSVNNRVQSLEDFMNNYFDNLDVQEEINNKLNAMVQDGTLGNIIGSYVDDYISATNTRLNIIETEVNLMTNKKYVFAGDSYSVGWTPDGDVKSWTEYCKDYLELTNSQYLLLGNGGASFGSSVNNFTMLVNNATADDDVTDVVCCGGYNEIGQSTANTLAGMLSFKNACQTKYPNAKIHVGFIGNTTDKTQKPNIAVRCGTYINGCAMYNMHYLNNVEYSLHRYYEDFASDGIHPNATGEEHIAYYVTQALRTGSADVVINNTYLVPYEQGGGLWHFQSNVRNEITNLFNIANTSFSYTSETLPAFAMTGSNAIDLFTIQDGNINGSGIYTTRGLIPSLLIQYEDNTYSVLNSCVFEIVDNKFKLYPEVLNAGATGYLTKQIKNITIRPFAHAFSTLDV